MVSPLLEGAGFSLQQKKVRLYMGILIIYRALLNTRAMEKEKMEHFYVLKNVIVLGAT